MSFIIVSAFSLVVKTYAFQHIVSVFELMKVVVVVDLVGSPSFDHSQLTVLLLFPNEKVERKLQCIKIV